MEENEIIYIPYGQDEISQQDLMTSLADGVESYLGSKRWAKKDKYRQAWLDAYQNIINRGITGASNDSGIWKINHKGDNFTLDTMSNTEREMYQDAAYYIQQKMAQMTPRKKEEEKKKEDLEKYGDFRTNLMNQILKGYGNNSELFKDSKQGWDAQDDRGADGLRGTEKRRAAMIKALSTYKDSLNNKDYNFEETPFKDKADLQTKIQAAIDALGTDEETDDLPAFNALGLPYRAFFNNGGNDIYDTTEDGKQITYQQYYDAKQKADKEKADKLALANTGVLSVSSGNKPIDAIYNTENYNKWLTQTYGSGQQGFDKINQQVQALLEKSYNQGKSNGLNQAERKQLGNLIHYIRTNNPKYQNYNLTPEEEEELSKHNTMKGRNLQDFVRLPWQTSDGRYTYADKSGNIYFLKPQNKKQLQQQAFTKSAEYNNYIKNFGKTQQQINNEQIEKLRNEDAQRTEINENDVLYLSSLIPDIASLFDEEPLSAGALGVTAAGIRNAALANRPGGMSLEDKLWQGLDYAGGAFSAMPFFGDAYVLGRILNTARKGATTLLGMAGVVGVSKDVYNLVKKFNNDETLTAREKIALASSIPLIINAYRSGRAWKQNKTIKAINEGEKTKQGTIEATNGSIKGIKKETAEALQKEFKKAGNDNAKKQEILKNNEEVVKLAKEQNIKIEDLQFESHLRNGKHSPFKKQQDIKLEDVPTGNPVYRQNYQKYLEELKQGNFWQRNKARGLREANWFYNATGGSRNTPNKGNWFTRAWNNTFGSNKTYDRIVNSSEIPTSKPSTETPKVGPTNIELYNKNVQYEHNILNTPNKNNSRLLQKGDSQSATLVDGNTYRFVYSNEGEAIVMLNGKPILNPVKVKNQKEAKEIFSKFVTELNSKIKNQNQNQFLKRFESKKYLEGIRELKRKGFFLKQGGTINNPYIDNVIEDFFKNNNI